MATGPTPHDPQETPVVPRTPPPISHLLKPRLATAVFRRYLRACIPSGPTIGNPPQADADRPHFPRHRTRPVHPGGSCPTRTPTPTT
ncbi:hypothetical protein GCM10010433_49490 [Streptomyces pulveraceus]